jgi:hypothetical protein
MAQAARRAGFVFLAALIGCGGLIHHDATVDVDFVAGGGPPTATASIASSQLTAPLSAAAGDLQKLSSVTLQSLRLQSTDSGDLSYVSGATLTVSGNGLPDAQLATLPGAPAAGQTAVDFTVDSSKDLRAYLAAGSLLKAEVTYASRPVAARGLKLTLVVRGSL